MRLLRFIKCGMMACLLVACSKDEADPAEVISPRTVMVYMAANNSLVSEAYQNLNQMEEGFVDIKGKLIVYARLFGQQPKIYEIVHDDSPEIKSRILKTYPEHDSSDPAIMEMIFADMKQLAPATSYGAILWSHATNWAPANMYKRMVGVKSFGDDNYSSMDVQTLKSALPSGLDFLIFDACSMASVEVLYELQDVAPYILASPTEVLSVGMPYDRINPLLFRPDVKSALVDVAKSYVDYYEGKTGMEQSATFSVVDTRQLTSLAASAKELFAKGPQYAVQIKRDGLQRLDLDKNTPAPAFDFQDMLRAHFPADQLASVEQALNRAVIFKTHTSHFLGQPITTFSGLSTYIPAASGEQELKTFYRTLSWYTGSGYSSWF